MLKQAITLTLVASIAIDVASAQCRDITLDACENGGEGPFETVKNLDRKLCQQFCAEIFPQRCTFFIYDSAQEICELFDTPQEDYVQSCQKLAGPKSPDVLNDCPTDPDDCTKFSEGYCRYESALLDNLDNISDLRLCQFACRLTEKCQYFVYDFSDKACQLLAGSVRNCDLLRGPPTPDYDTLDCETPVTTPEPIFDNSFF